jgi:hypothetical protein
MNRIPVLCIDLIVSQNAFSTMLVVRPILRASKVTSHLERVGDSIIFCLAGAYLLQQRHDIHLLLNIRYKSS